MQWWLSYYTVFCHLHVQFQHSPTWPSDVQCEVMCEEPASLSCVSSPIGRICCLLYTLSRDLLLEVYLILFHSKCQYRRSSYSYAAMVSLTRSPEISKHAFLAALCRTDISNWWWDCSMHISWSEFLVSIGPWCTWNYLFICRGKPHPVEEQVQEVGVVSGWGTGCAQQCVYALLC